MKKSLFMFFALILCSSCGQTLYARGMNKGMNGMYGNGMYQAQEMSGDYEGDAACPAPYQSGPCICYCPVTRFRPSYYCVNRSCQEPYTVQKKCCRYVPQYYTKQHCRMVPEYYTKTYCRQVPEYYCVPETRYRTRCWQERKCRYIPYTTIEKKCIDNPDGGCPTCPTACPSDCPCPSDGYDSQSASWSQGSCPSGACPSCPGM